MYKDDHSEGLVMVYANVDYVVAHEADLKRS